MSGPGTLASRVVRGSLFVAALTALSLAGAASIIAHLAWEAGEARRVRESAQALVESIRADARDDEKPNVDSSAADTLRESGLPGYRLEVWRGATLVSASQAGPTIGPGPLPDGAAAWIVASEPIDDRTVLTVAAPREHGLRALRVFLLSLGVAAPLCLALAWIVGRAVSSRATGPLEELRDRVLAARPGEAFPAPVHSKPPSEVRDLDDAFREVWDRLGAALAREREFAANASHELRTPLTRIRLNVERAAQKWGPDAPGELAEARREVDRMARLVDSLLVLARDVSAGVSNEVVNVSDVARQAVARVLPQAGAAAVSAPDEAMARGDEELLSIAIENLLDNARKFRASGEAVRVEVASAGDRVRVFVGSPGARISADLRERAFERFYRGAEARTGADGHGLGLPLCRHIARLHGGDARCASAPHEDARFVLEVPAWEPQGGRPRIEGLEAEAGSKE
jgi:signal transduction histidine kinase